MIPMRMAMQLLRDINHNSFSFFSEPKPNTKHSEMIVRARPDDNWDIPDDEQGRDQENLEEEKKKLIAAICHFGSSKPNNLIELVRNRRKE